MPTRKKATAADGELILKLYDLRREPEMRKARNAMFTDFWPESAEDFLAIARAYGTDLNRYVRQVFGYWDMACSLVLHGALNEDLFFDCSHEMYPLFAKVRPFTREFREATGSPDAFASMEKLILRTKQSRDRLARVEERLARFKEFAAKSGGKSR
jgi:hypothetical protein